MVFTGNEIKFGIEQKQSLGLIRPDGRYTNLALVLSDQCPYTTKAAIFEGTGKANFKDRKEFAGSVFRQINDVLAYLRVYNRIGGDFEGTYRIDHADYPEITLREAYINALIHRDYYIEGSVLVNMFDDRLEFMSLGGIMPGVTRDLMIAGVSVARNEKLARVFYRLNMVEAFGTGIPRIFDAYENSGAKPEIPVIDGGFLIRLPNRNYARSLAKNANGANAHAKACVTDSVITEGSNEHRLLEVLPKTGFSKEQAARELEISESGAYKLLERMKERGFLVAAKRGRKWIYRAANAD